jgi:hypothetical protein
MPRRLELIGIDIHADAHSRLSQAIEVAVIEAAPFLGPGIIGVVQMGLSIVCDRLSVAVDYKEGVVPLSRDDPVLEDVHAFGVADGYSTVVLECGGSGPQGA